MSSALPRSARIAGIVRRMDGREWHDESGWHYEPPKIDPHADKLTLALLEDLSNLLVVNGYPSLRGVAPEQITRALLHLQHPD